MSKFERDSERRLPVLNANKDRISSTEFSQLERAISGMGYREVKGGALCRFDEHGLWRPVVFDGEIFDSSWAALNRAEARGADIGKTSVNTSSVRARDRGRAGGFRLK